MSVDINNLNLENEQVEYDVDAELSTPMATVPDGTYLATLSPGKFGIKKQATKDGKPYVSAHVSGKIIAPGTPWDGRFVNSTINSLVFNDDDGKPTTSPIFQMLKAVGQPAPSPVSISQLASLVESALGANLQCRIRTRWEASCANSETDKEGNAVESKKKYLRVRGMKHFEQNGDGTYNPEYTFELANGDKEVKEAYPAIVDFKPATAGASN